ncbi:rhodanese-like domain-containing protein [uncultured Thiodictyon sp.]|jgi:rhodanese-related sulfurtransferase|uniref:rhodanese-like domain-containing protein n=1 Tax=uncultured Thiodictyon sp. TaxID=1846217 RepID=UPI0025D17251|nr:rhodanese-like domain-containing protein [uncultured Thiodictyon sp.]
MQVSQLFEFVVHNWYLFVALVVILALLIHNLIVGERGNVEPLGATEMINHKDATVIDVRSAADFAAGHIVNAVNIPMNGFKNQLAVLGKYKGKPIIVNCKSGGQSGAACEHLRKQGFEEVYNLKGGILAWQAANLPLSRKKR